MKLRTQLALAFSFFFAICTHAQVYAADNPAAPTADKQTLTLGIFPRRSPAETIKRFSPLVQYLERTLQRPVELVLEKDYGLFASRLYREKFDLVHINQYQYIKVHDELGYEVVAQNEEFGNKTLRAAIYAKKDSGLNSLQDLRGKTISFGGGKQAVISYIVPTHMLHQAGLMQGDYTEKFVRNPPNALLTTYSGFADAAGAGDKALELPLIKQMIDPEQMKIIAVSEEFAHLPWAVKGDLDPALAAALRTALLQLKITKEGRQILKAAALTSLNPVSDSDYDPLREILRAHCAHGKLVTGCLHDHMQQQPL